MPEFEENTGYKMKGSTFYGKGNQSPAKVSDKDVVAAQDKLDHTELDFREPGWAKAARGIHEGATSVVSSFSEGEKAAEAAGGAEGAQQQLTVEEIAKKNELQKPQENQLKRGTVDGLNYVPPS